MYTINSWILILTWLVLNHSSVLIESCCPPYQMKSCPVQLKCNTYGIKMHSSYVSSFQRHLNIKRSTYKLQTSDFVELKQVILEFYKAIMSWLHNIQMLFDDGNRITFPQGNLKIYDNLLKQARTHGPWHISRSRVTGHPVAYGTNNIEMHGLIFVLF